MPGHSPDVTFLFDDTHAPASLPAAPCGLEAARTALFLDFDGTLAPIVANPADARPSRRARALLARLERLTGGAVAIVSGRPLESLDTLLAPLVLPAAGVHGRQRRTADGHVRHAGTASSELAAADARLAAFAHPHHGMLVERKPGAVALHFRLRPEMEDAARALTRAIAEASPSLRLLEGKMVAELAVGALGKGDAVAAFMAESPFAGRVPVYFGDDVTDEDAYPAVEAAGGLSVRIGPGKTRARFRLDGVDALEAWMAALAEAWEGR